jgi:phage baseplate assembly protein W
MPKARENRIGFVIDRLLDSALRSVALFSSRTEVMRATRRHRPRGRARTVEVLVTVGAPNYAERKFLKRFKNPCGMLRLREFSKPKRV